jgi:type IV pilus assembly protein PilW
MDKFLLSTKQPASAGSRLQRGVSLIELMIAMTLGLVVIAAVGYVYVTGTVGYRVQDGQSRMQEDARFIIETVSRDVRMAGYFGCARSDLLPDKTGFVELNASQPVMTLNTDWLLVGGRADTSIEGRYLDPSNFIRGISAGASNASAALPSYATLGGKLQPNTDVLLVIRAGEEHVAVTKSGDSTAEMPQSIPGASDRDSVTLVISDCSRAKIMKPTYESLKPAFPGVKLSVDNAMFNSNGSTGGPAGQFPTLDNGAVASMFAPSIFYVAKPAGTGKLPTLKRASIGQNKPTNYGGWALTGGEIVASGVETFSTSYIVTSGIGTAAATSQEMSLASMEATPANWPNVTAVRVRFTMMSQEANTALTQTDGRLRQSYDFTVGIRGRQYTGAL